ncbi:MAG: radical SAM protein [Nanoarchaeota archaeon]|nr:radical SAM protein [Nanoarchaeota archaeon]
MKIKKGFNDFLFYASRKLNYPLNKPDWVSVNLTLKCNLKCSMCQTCYEVKDELTTEEIKDLMEQVEEWDVKTFNAIGGEPFVRPDIMELLEYASKKKFYTTITTNGTLIDKQRAEKLADWDKITLIFSIDGFEEEHDNIRGGGSFKKAVETIKAIRKFEKENNLHPKHISVNCIIHDRNFKNLIDFMGFIKSLGANGVQFLGLFDLKKNKNLSLWIRESKLNEFNTAIDKLCGYIKNDNSGFNYANSVKNLQLFKKYYSKTLDSNELKCYNGLKEFYINSDGNGIMCDGKLNFIANKMGNIRKDSLKNIWKSKKAKEMRKKIKNCKHPCIQECYLRQDSDCLKNILKTIISK